MWMCFFMRSMFLLLKVKMACVGLKKYIRACLGAEKAFSWIVIFTEHCYLCACFINKKKLYGRFSQEVSDRSAEF